VKNRYSQTMYIGRVRNVLCGVMRIPEGLDAEGEKYLQALTDLLGKAPAAKSRAAEDDRPSPSRRRSGMRWVRWMTTNSSTWPSP